MTDHKDSSAAPTWEEYCNESSGPEIADIVQVLPLTPQPETVTTTTHVVGGTVKWIVGYEVLTPSTSFDTWFNAWRKRVLMPKEESDEARTAAFEVWQMKERELAVVQQSNAELRHDIARHVQIATDLTNDLAEANARVATERKAQIFERTKEEAIRIVRDSPSAYRDEIAFHISEITIDALTPEDGGEKEGK